MLYINETTNKIYVATDNKEHVRGKRSVIFIQHVYRQIAWKLTDIIVTIDVSL